MGLAICGEAKIAIGTFVDQITDGDVSGGTSFRLDGVDAPSAINLPGPRTARVGLRH
jgi:hypothetical protein